MAIGQKVPYLMLGAASKALNPHEQHYLSSQLGARDSRFWHLAIDADMRGPSRLLWALEQLGYEYDPNHPSSACGALVAADGRVYPL